MRQSALNTQDTLRQWILERLAKRNRGTRARLADFLHMSPSQLSNMLNMKAGKETRNIRVDELLKILDFFDVPLEELSLPRITDEESNRAVFMRFYDSAPPEQQASLAKLMHIYNNAKPKQRQAIINIVRALAETYNIPH